MTAEEWAAAIAAALNSKCEGMESSAQNARGADPCDRWKFEWARDKLKAQRDSLIEKARKFGDRDVMQRALDPYMLGYLLDHAT
ncbi:hypothetical protein [Nocardia sp. NPDC047648]|uniref:hypothetical protein n=1 Tax=Nocardia sp. NPDC047648 TaxID=3155625 RepID=UPI00340F4713